MRKIIIFIFLGIFSRSVLSVSLSSAKLYQFSLKHTYSQVYMREECRSNIEEELGLILTLEKKNKLSIDTEQRSEIIKLLAKAESRLAHYYSDEGDHPSSLNHYQKSFDLNPLPKIKRDIGIEYTALGEYRKGQKILHELLLQVPTATERMLPPLVINYARQEDYENVLSYSKKIIMESPKSEDANYAAIYIILSQLYLNRVNPVNLDSLLQANLDLEGWPGPLVKFLMGQSKEEDLIAFFQNQKDKDLRGMLCETMCYLGEFYRAIGDKKLATQYYQATLATKVNGFIEYGIAQKRLGYIK